MPAVQLSTVVVCAFFLSSSSALNQHESEITQHRDHVESIAEFSCLLPQPRLIPLHKLFFEDQLKSKAFFPDVTVLHRCNECTGSCPSGLTCGVKTSEQVALTFKATYLDDVGQHKKGTWQMESHKLLNHTECACAVADPQVDDVMRIASSSSDVTFTPSPSRDDVMRIATSSSDDTSTPSPSGDDVLLVAIFIELQR